MSEELKASADTNTTETQTDVIVLIKNMQQQLIYLEKKIDALIGQLQQRPSEDRPYREKRFERSFRSFDRSRSQGHYRGRGDQERDPRDRSFRPGRHFGKRDSEERQDFGRPREDRDRGFDGVSGQERPFKKSFGGGKKEFNPRKKSFFRGRRDR
ncbi:MAG TPA: hypothetical protein PLO93_00895 [Candidatus Omnitrophota bacterium]|nr:hypothetical protein [Candidatus Omnitrophota bacterium]HQL40835.1 hypothetical protein [Candidatus Omnitrophota bacterium]